MYKKIQEDFLGLGFLDLGCWSYFVRPLFFKIFLLEICYLLCNAYIPTLSCTEFESVFYHTVHVLICRSLSWT